MRLSANKGKVFRHVHEPRYPMKTHIQSLVIWICVFIGCRDSCMNPDIWICIFIEYLDSCMP